MLLNHASNWSRRIAALIVIVAAPVTANALNLGIVSSVQGEPNRDVGRDPAANMFGNGAGSAMAAISANPVMTAVGWSGPAPLMLGGGGSGIFLPALAPAVANLPPTMIPVSRGLDTIIAPGSRWESSAQVRAQTAAAAVAAANPVPDGGLTVALLGTTLLSLVWVRSRLAHGNKPKA